MSRVRSGPAVEDALLDANCMAEVAYTFIATGLGFEGREPPRLTERECTLPYWVMCQTVHRIRVVQQAFDYEQEAGK